MQRMCLIGISAVLLGACAHHPVPADCTTHLERINTQDVNAPAPAPQVDETEKEHAP